ncbi:hypothetical protein BGZ54_000212 [Gamsiella multidivaricata]|nr:hypothetical protein BGZ54_000212 [Gamsiella multidivaricata]
MVCLVQDTTEGSESHQFEGRFADTSVLSELSGLNLVPLRLIKDSVDGMMFGQIFPIMTVPALYLIRNGLLTDFINSTVDKDQMLDRIKRAVDGHSQIRPPPNTVIPTASAAAAEAPTGGSSVQESVSEPTLGTTSIVADRTGTLTASTPTSSPHVAAAPPMDVPSEAPAEASLSNLLSNTSATAVDQAQTLKELMKERKLKREKEEKEAAKQREINRRASSKALSEAQREMSDKQGNKLKEQIEREKREEAEYKKRVKQALEEDKARRRAQKEKAQAAAAAQSSPPPPEQVLTPAEIRAQNAGLTLARNDSAPALAYDSSRLNIRLFDGSSIRNTFKATDTLDQVREWINQHQVEDHGAYNIVQLIPLRTFTDESKMLRDLELCPSATLVLKRTTAASSAYEGSAGGAVPTLINYGWSALSLAGKAASSAYATVSYYNPLASTGASSSSTADRPNEHGRNTSESARSKKKDTEVNYNGNSTNLE